MNLPLSGLQVLGSGIALARLLARRESGSGLVQHLDELPALEALSSRADPRPVHGSHCRVGQGAGELGSVDAEGFVRITGRKKELMKSGKYVAPVKLEGRLDLLPIVQEAVTVADTRNYVTALIADGSALVTRQTLVANSLPSL